MFFFARIGGDEFALCIVQMHEEADANAIALSLCGVLQEKFIIEDIEIKISASIGIVCFSDNKKNIDELMRCADSAMYQAKKSGGNGFKVYSPEDNLRAD